MAPRSGQRAFTLIELLVVLSILMLLLALLMPTIGMVRSAAKRVQCASNLRQIGMVVGTYVNDFGQFPATEGPVAGVFPHLIAGIVNPKLPAIFSDYAGGNVSLFYCPANAQARNKSNNWPNAGLAAYCMTYGLMPWCMKTNFLVPAPSYTPLPGPNDIVGSDFYATLDTARAVNLVFNHSSRGVPVGMNELYGDGHVTWHGSTGTWTNWLKDSSNGFYWWVLDWQ